MVFERENTGASSVKNSRQWVPVHCQYVKGARVSDTQLSANMIVSLRKKPRSSREGSSILCCWILLIGAGGLFFLFRSMLSSGGCGRRMLLGAEDLQWALGWLVGQDVVRLEACGRPFLEGGRAMMAAAVEAADSDWWSAEL